MHTQRVNANIPVLLSSKTYFLVRISNSNSSYFFHGWVRPHVNREMGRAEAHFPHKSRHFLITSQIFSRSVNIYEISICSKSPSFSWIQRQTILYCNYKWEQNSSILKDLGNNAGNRQASWRTKASLDQSIHANKDDNYTREQDCLYFIVVWGAVQQCWDPRDCSPLQWVMKDGNDLQLSSTRIFFLLRRRADITEHRANRRSTVCPIPILTAPS